MAISRRHFLASAAAVPFSRWIDQVGAAGSPFQRCEARTPTGQSMLQLYANAVQKMKNTASSSPSSWVFQWYTHWVPGKEPPDTTSKTSEIARIFASDPTYQSLASDMWDTCEAHGDPENEMLFLPWHRMFVYFLERIVRKASDPSFALPYWNYSVTGSNHGVD